MRLCRNLDQNCEASLNEIRTIRELLTHRFGDEWALQPFGIRMVAEEALHSDRKEQAEIWHRIAARIRNLCDPDLGPAINRNLSGIASAMAKYGDFLSAPIGSTAAVKENETGGE